MDGMVGAENQPLDRLVKGRVAGRSHIRFRGLTIYNVSFRSANRGENRCLTLVVSIYAHAEIDFFGIFVRPEGGHEAKDGVVRQAVEPFKHGKTPVRVAAKVARSLQAKSRAWDELAPADPRVATPRYAKARAALGKTRATPVSSRQTSGPF
jgi:hypothetical protein